MTFEHTPERIFRDPSFSGSESDSRRPSAPQPQSRHALRSPRRRSRNKSDKSLKERRNRKIQRDTIAAAEDVMRCYINLFLPADRQLHSPNTGSSGLTYNKESNMLAELRLLVSLLSERYSREAMAGRLEEWQREEIQGIHQFLESPYTLAGTWLDAGSDASCICGAGLPFDECQKCRFEQRNAAFLQYAGGFRPHL
ncbi:hypothetical protein K431DRAFT_285454 [Polychaeton citri CBS 116435]|uniref:Uncharacterized protein n=1 Tax=Polychaeton citri CBS 116435 TaxID=1314669 RepID=A0A9P4Q546_9PEZI|nr:hypothetical protein K431DRAFT_285454 [Polychaeton citri CBS 116435]